MTQITVYAGKTHTISLAYTSDGDTPIDITGSTARMMVRKSIYAPPTLELTAVIDGAAITEASYIANNLMAPSMLSGLTDVQLPSFGSFFDVAVVIGTTTSSGRPTFKSMTIDYDANIKNVPAISGVDYEVDHPTNDKVRVKALADSNLKIRVV